MLGWIGSINLADQVVQRRAQENDESRRSGLELPKGVWSVGGHDHRGACRGGDVLLLELEPERSRNDVPGLIIGVVDVVARRRVCPVGGPIPDYESRSPDNYSGGP
jgi:hypothetical protein